jgi:Tol biopolymer transport system component
MKGLSMSTLQVTERWSRESAYWPSDPVSGAEIEQLTGNVGIATSIYCEDPACSPENRIAIVRSLYCDARRPAELLVTDVETGLSVPVDTEMSWQGACAQAYGDLFYYPRRVEGRWELRRLRFSTLEVEVVHQFPGGAVDFRCLGSVSPDGRRLVNERALDDGRHEVFVLDLETGREQSIAAGEDYCNPHPRFDRRQGEWVLVQRNRGFRRDPVTGLVETTDRTLGTTLELCKADGSERHILPIARPIVPQGVSGHESWLKDRHAFIYSTSPLDPPYDDGRRTGNLLRYRIGDEKPTVIAHAPDIYFGHVSASACGRYWCCDGWPWAHDGTDACRVAPRVYVGNIETGNFAAVCEVGGVWPRYENGHAHPYLSADNRHVVFTSSRAGFPQVFKATLAEGWLERL